MEMSKMFVLRCILLSVFALSPFVLTATVAYPQPDQTSPIIQTLSSDGIGPAYAPANKVNVTDAEQAAPKKVVEDAQFWLKVGLKQLNKTIKWAKLADETSYKHKAKNIIIFVGDGMGLSTITAGRIYKGQYLKHGFGEEEMLAFDEFPHTGLAKTYNVDKQVPDSAGTATAMFTGIKTHYGAIGVDATRSKTDAKVGRLQSMIDWAQAEGKRTGVVTTTRITHATPASTYARIYDRDWECDTEVPAESQGIHVDIARQLVENAPGNKLNVIMGGGLSPMGALNISEIRTVDFQGDTETICSRGDNRNLTAEWLRLGEGNPSDSRVFVHNREQLLKVDLKNVDHVMGLFRNNHITYSIAREQGEPSLAEMTAAALEVLERKDSNGFVLLVEGGRIDQGHHQNYARAALHEVYEFDLAVQAALKATKSEETLILVTADHSHAVTFNGYPLRGSDILGTANSHKNDHMVYETITYANGPGYYEHLGNGTVHVNSSQNLVWRPQALYTKSEVESPTYRHLATVPLNTETHGGEDVIVFAHGPGASLVRGVFEQNYLAYVMSYAGCMGPAKNVDDTCNPNTAASNENRTQSGSHANSGTGTPSLELGLFLLIASILRIVYV